MLKRTVSLQLGTTHMLGGFVKKSSNSGGLMDWQQSEVAKWQSTALFFVIRLLSIVSWLNQQCFLVSSPKISQYCICPFFHASGTFSTLELQKHQKWKTGISWSTGTFYLKLVSQNSIHADSKITNRYGCSCDMNMLYNMYKYMW